MEPPQTRHISKPSPPPMRMTRKRAASISIEEANHARLQQLSLSTPTSATAPPVESRKICICKKEHIPRPRNSFILYRQHRQARVAAENPGVPNPEMSKLIAQEWNAASEELKEPWKKAAEQEKQLHQAKYPGYHYRPRRGGKGGKGRAPSNTPAPGSLCPDCGGSYIATATPRTPTTPASAAGSAGTPPDTAGSVSPTEEDHYRRRSHVGPVMARPPPTQFAVHPASGPREIRPEYDPAYSPEAKRRRYNGPVVHHPAQSPPPASFGQYARHHATVGPPKARQVYPQGPPIPIYPAFNMRPEAGQMLPPPRPQSISYPHPPRGTHFDESPAMPPPRSAGFGEGHRLLPSLQTVISPSPTDAAAGYSNSRYPSPPGAISGEAEDSRAEADATSISCFNKILALGKISPPLRAPGPGSPRLETRGPLISVEGQSPKVLEEVAAVIERSLVGSGEVALKKWVDEGRTPLVNASELEARDGGMGPYSQQEMGRCLAAYLGRITQWHEKSRQIIHHITTLPRKTPEPEKGAGRSQSEGTIPAAGSSSNGASGGSAGPAEGAGSKLLPVALIPSGFSLTLSDKFAGSIPIADIYKPIDHWHWMASGWRGVIGPDLHVCVTPCTEEEIRRKGVFEVMGQGAVVVNYVEGRGMDEKTRRRVAFEVMEWVRTFRMAFN